MAFHTLEGLASSVGGNFIAPLEWALASFTISRTSVVTADAPKMGVRDSPDLTTTIYVGNQLASRDFVPRGVSLGTLSGAIGDSKFGEGSRQGDFIFVVPFRTVAATVTIYRPI